MSRQKGAIYCNRCGKIICPEEMQDKTSFLIVRKAWGYFSENKDGKIYSVELCEPCCDEMAQEFAIAPRIEDSTEFI